MDIHTLTNSSCVQGGKPRFSMAVYAQPPEMKKVVMYSQSQVADRKECWAKARGGLLHEMFHMFGVMHTQMRADRDNYITINNNNIQPSYRREYEVGSSV